MVLSIVWGEEVQRDMADVYQIVHAVGFSNAYQLAKIQAQAKHRLIMQALALLCGGVAPDLSELSEGLILAPLVTPGMITNCRVGDTVFVGVSALREVMTKANEDTATNKVCKLFKLSDFFAPQDIRQDVRNTVAPEAKREIRECQLAVVALVLLQGHGRA